MRPRALVTGAGARVGRAIAIELARAGFDVGVHYNRSEGPAAQTATLCRERGAHAWTVGGDLGTAEGCSAVVEATKTHWDSLHVLVNNASLFYPVAFGDITDAEWERMLAVNLLAPFRLSRDLLPLLTTADGSAVGAPDGQHGLVVHLCDIGADRPVSGHAHYSVSKAGLVMLVKAMAIELAPAIRTVGVSPGQVAWPPDYDADKRARLTRRIPLHRVGTPEDVGTLVRFLALEAHYLNGIVVPVDGGLACRY